MDHLDAEQLKAVERYMLGDLSVSEVEEFERHFFDCPQCSEELRALTMFQENARAVFSEQDFIERNFIEHDVAVVPASVHVPQSTGWWQRFSPLSFSLAAAACLVIGIFAGRNVLAPRETLGAGAEYPIYAQARGEETVIPAVRNEKFGLYLDPSWEGDYKTYRAVLLDAAGKEQVQVPVKDVPPSAAIHLWVPSNGLAEGKYILVMFAAEKEVARFPFTLKFQ